MLNRLGHLRYWPAGVVAATTLRNPLAWSHEQNSSRQGVLPHDFDTCAGPSVLDFPVRALSLHERLRLDRRGGVNSDGGLEKDLVKGFHAEGCHTMLLFDSSSKEMLEMLKR